MVLNLGLMTQEAKDRREQRQQELFDLLIYYTESNQMISLPRLFTQAADWPQMILHDQLYQQVLGSVPLAHLCASPQGRSQVLQLTDDLMRWSTENNQNEDRVVRRLEQDRPWLREPHEMLYWNYFWGHWLARISPFLSSNEWQTHCLEPMETIWKNSPVPVTYWLQGIGHTDFTGETLRPEALERWHTVGRIVLNTVREMTPEECNWWMQYTDNAKAAAQVIFITSGAMKPYCLLPDNSPHLSLCRDTIDEWISLLGATSSGYMYLSTLLEGAGWQFAPEPALEWQFNIWQTVLDPAALVLQYQNGERVARWLHRLWREYRAIIRTSTITRDRLGTLLDILIQNGTAQAAALRHDIEISAEN